MKRNSAKGIIICPLVVAILFTAGACRNNHFRVDVSGIQSNIKIQRFEQDLFSTDPSSLEEFIPKWQKEYDHFFNYWCFVTGVGDTSDPAMPERLRAFVTDRQNYEIFKRTREVYPDVNTITSQLNDAFKHFVYYFPDKNIPAVYTYISGFARSAITGDSLLAIGLDRYLGKDEMFYKQAGFYNYLTVNMHPGKIVSDCMSFWAETEFAFNDSVDNLICNMIYRGRLLYFNSAMLPEQPDSLNFGFSNDALNYLDQSEKSMWAFLIERKLLFNTDRLTISKFIQEGPFTTDFGHDSPARAAVWTGYRITKAFMERNPSVTLEELMEERNYLTILNNSGYNP